MATIFTALQDVQARIRDACTAASRNDNEVILLAVSKTFPSSDIRTLYEHGHRAFGENYAQELATKQHELSDCTDLEWHFIGPIQSNKTRLVAENAAWVHTIDRFKIAERLAKQRPSDMMPLNICLQVNVSGEGSKSGVAPNQLLELAQQVSQFMDLLEKVAPFTTITSFEIAGSRSTDVVEENSDEPEVIQVTIETKTFFYNPSVKQAVAASLPKLSQENTVVLAKLAEFMTIPLPEQREITGGGSEDIFGVKTIEGL